MPASRRRPSPERQARGATNTTAGIDLIPTLDLFGVAGTQEQDAVTELVSELSTELRASGRLPETATLRVASWRYGILTLGADPQSVTLLRYDLDRLREQLRFSFDLRGLTLNGVKLAVARHG